MISGGSVLQLDRVSLNRTLIILFFENDYRTCSSISAINDAFVFKNDQQILHRNVAVHTVNNVTKCNDQDRAFDAIGGPAPTLMRTIAAHTKMIAFTPAIIVNGEP